MSLLVSYSGCFMCDFYLYLFCKRESVKLEGSNFVFILLLCLRSKANALVITNRNGEVFRYDKRYHVSQQVLHYYLGNTSELSILYSTYRGTNFIESMICDGTVLIDIQENIDYYYSELKSTAAVGGIFGFLAIIAAVIPVILFIKKKK